MQVPKWVAWISVLDCLMFFVADVSRTFAKNDWIGPSHWVYWVTVWLGFALALNGFYVLTRGSQTQLKKAVVSILFAMIPACVGLVTVLAQIGSPVGGVHV